MSVANPEIFKAYDIRGLYGSDIDEGLAERPECTITGGNENRGTGLVNPFN